MAKRVLVKCLHLCNDPARKTIWNVKLNRPVDPEQFFIIDRIIHSLRIAKDNFFIVDFKPSIHHASYIQITRNNENDFYIELHFDFPCFFSYRINEKGKIRKHPWSQSCFHAKSPEAASDIFKEVLCRGCLPDLSRWKDCTKKIYIEKFLKKA